MNKQKLATKLLQVLLWTDFTAIFVAKGKFIFSILISVIAMIKRLSSWRPRNRYESKTMFKK